MKLNVNSGRKGNSSYTFNPMSLVSMDFGRLQPLRSFSVLLGDNFTRFRSRGLLRCTPQVFPPFGRMNLKSAAFFVPDSQLFSWAPSFHADNKLWRGQDSTEVPRFWASQFNIYFASNIYLTGLSTSVASNPAAEPALNTYDFCSPSGTRAANSTNLDYFKLTPLGWKVFSVFKSLGYDFVIYPTDFANTLTYAQHVSNSDTLLSAIPMLAYCKIWNDFFCNSYQTDKNVVAEALQKIYLNKNVVVNGTTLYDSSTISIDLGLFFYLFMNLRLPYESNMYTNAWNNPNDPTGVENAGLNQVNQQSLISPYGFGSNGEFGTLSASSSRNTHYSDVSSSTGYNSYFSELGHKTLEAFDKFVRRRNLVGSKAVQQLYSLFGIKPAEWNKDYVVKLAEGSNRINFSAITSQSDTENGGNGKPLGAFAGVGLSGYNLDFSYKADTYGTIICLAWLNIDPILMRGVSPDVLRIKPLDFYSPDYDGKAYRPIPYMEVTGGKSIGVDGKNAKSIYGYTNMYDDYRMMRDVVAGSFVDETTQHFAFMRDLSITRRNMAVDGLEMYPQTSDVQYWFIDGNSDLTNPFITSPSVGDRFWFCVDFDINCTRPILSAENSFDLDGEGSLTVSKNGDGMA